MCKAFSCICLESGRILWKLGTDSHEDLLSAEKIRDADTQPNFARVEITPDNGDYRHPDKWSLNIDENATPVWWSPAYEAACWDAHKAWSKKLYKILDTKKVILNPFRDIKPPKKITKKHIALLKEWASVGASVVWASVGSLFSIPKKDWKYTEKLTGQGYPFQAAVNLWDLGLVPSFDGKTWRLHGGKNAKVLFEITEEKLKK